MNLYLDSSALLKRYLAEEGAVQFEAAFDEASGCAASRITFVETMRGLAAEPDQSARARKDWESVNVVELSPVVCERAVTVAKVRSLKTLDAIHLASALVIATDDLTFATFDRRLHAAAHAEGLTTLPAALS